MKFHLTTKNLHHAIEDETDNPVGEVEKTTAMIFIQRHIHDALQTEYLAKEDPRALWVTLVDRFDHQEDIFLPEARHDWQHLRFQDFKFVNEYNSEQQYRAQTKFLDLISVLPLAEKQNQLLMKNHQARLIGATVMPEAHYSMNQRLKCQKRRGSAARSPPWFKVNRANAYLREETKLKSTLTSISMP
ncbi:uncharacterized protein [Malus domestica]|uniref:uncharacterized protein n=1 Tax=Malus domestica TaxID=3750 RepID=UPI003974A407